jgi:hypothetical protein
MPLNSLGFGFAAGARRFEETDPQSGGDVYFGHWWRNVVVPDWFLVALTAALPLGRVALFCCRRRNIGGCARCGYDLRAIPDRCPEWGMVRSVPAEGS